MADNTVKVSFIGDSSSLKKAVDDSDSHLARFSSSVAGMAKAAALGFAAAGAGLAVFAKSAVSAASNLAESQSKVGVVFGEQAKDIESWASRSAKAFGQSRQSALEAVGTYGNLFQAFGVGRAQSADMSKSLVELAADMASFNNTSVDDALLALQSGLSGETEPLKRFGVALSDVRLKDEAVRLGLIKTTKEALTPAAKAQASYSLIMRDTALAQGDFGRTSDGLANRTRILQARFADIQAEIGTKLLPVVVRMAGFILDRVIPAFSWLANEVVLAVQLIVAGFQTMDRTSSGFHGRMEEIGIVLRRVFEWMRDTIPPIVQAVFGWLRDNVPPILSEIGRIAGDVFEQRLVPAFNAVADVVMNVLWPALQTVFNFVNEHREILVGVAVAIGVGLVAAFLSWAAAAAAAAAATIAATAPIIAIGVAIAALVAGVIYAYTHWGWFRDTVDTVARFLTDKLWPAIKAVSDFIIGDVVPVIATLIGWYIKWIEFQIQVALAVGKAIAEIIGFFRDVGVAVYQFAVNFGQFVAGMAQQLAEWVLTVWRLGGEVIQWFRDLPGAILRAIGNLADLLYDIGKEILNSLWKGMKDMWESVKGWVGSIGGWIKDLKGPIASDRVLLFDEGQAIIEGLGAGMADEWGNVADDLSGYAAALSSPFEAVDLTGVGAGMIEGLAAGIASAAPSIEAAYADLMAITEENLRRWADMGIPIVDENGRIITDPSRVPTGPNYGTAPPMIDPNTLLSGFAANIPSFADGGIMPGPRGKHALAWVAGGEHITKDGGGNVINIYIGRVDANSPVALNGALSSMSRELAVALRGSVA